MQCANTGMHVSSSQGVTDVNNQKISTQQGVTSEATKPSFSQALQMRQFQSQAESVNKHTNLLMQGVTLPSLPHQRAGVQFSDTADHVSFPVSQAVTVQMGKTGDAEGHSRRSRNFVSRIS